MTATAVAALTRTEALLDFPLEDFGGANPGVFADRADFFPDGRLAD